MQQARYKNIEGGFPGGAVVGSLPASAGDMGSIPGRGTQILHATQCSQIKKKLRGNKDPKIDRKSTRLNSSH